MLLGAATSAPRSGFTILPELEEEEAEHSGRLAPNLGGSGFSVVGRASVDGRGSSALRAEFRRLLTRGPHILRHVLDGPLLCTGRRTEFVSSRSDEGELPYMSPSRYRLTVAVEKVECRKSFPLTRNGPTARVKRREHDPSVTPIRSGSD